MAVIETLSALLTISSLVATIYFKRYAVKRFLKRQHHLIKLKYRRYRDKKATNRTKVDYMPIHELETVGLKHADNLEELGDEILSEQFPDNVEVIDLQAQPKSTNLSDNLSNNTTSTSSETLETIESYDETHSFLTAREMPMEISNSVNI